MDPSPQWQPIGRLAVAAAALTGELSEGEEGAPVGPDGAGVVSRGTPQAPPAPLPPA